MTELQHLTDTIRRAYEGDAWHGPSLSEVLEGIDAVRASEKIGDAHTIWELTLHITAWLDIVRRRLEGEKLDDSNLTMRDDWPPAPKEVTEAKWAETKDALEQASRKLLETVKSFPESKLEDQVLGRDYSYSVMLHGAAQHSLYHAGQISLLKKIDK
jgi:uncharacterized damage-inducible protein DinB